LGPAGADPSARADRGRRSGAVLDAIDVVADAIEDGTREAIDE
jgi:hypothetical protein